MQLELDDRHQRDQARFRQFAAQHVAPSAAAADRAERLPDRVIQALAEACCLGSFLPEQWGGQALDMISYGVLHEEIGKACTSARSLLTVHDMVTHAILKWGTACQRRRYLPAMARGEMIGAFAVSEPGAGSDVRSIETSARRENGAWLLNGTKTWVTFGQTADVFLVLARAGDEPAAFLVDRAVAGLSVTPISGMIGMRASMLAEVVFQDCEIADTAIIAKPGFGLSPVVFDALGIGRYSVAWGSVAIAQAAVDACMQYTDERRQFGSALREYQLIQHLLTDMIVETEAARLLCLRAGYLKQKGDPQEVLHTLAAKYFSARTAMRAASDAVQIHGANGCSSAYPVQRYLRDAKVMEIIEGSNQMQQMMIAKQARQYFAPVTAERAAHMGAARG